MSYFERAKSMHARGDAVRTAVILAQGLKRDPSDAEAVEWLLHLYVEEVPNTGLEDAILQVLARLPNGADLLDIVRGELDEVGAGDKLRALDKTLEHSGIRFHAPPDPAHVSGASAGVADATEPASAVEHAAGTGENWDAFDNPFADAARTNGATGARSTGAHADAGHLSHPLGTLDTLPEALRSEYLQETPLPSKPSRSQHGVWLLIAAVAAVIVGAIAAYSIAAGGSDEVEPARTWADDGSGE